MLLAVPRGQFQIQGLHMFKHYCRFHPIINRDKTEEISYHVDKRPSFGLNIFPLFQLPLFLLTVYTTAYGVG